MLCLRINACTHVRTNEKDNKNVTDFCTLRVLKRTFMPAVRNCLVTSSICPGDTMMLTSLPTGPGPCQKSVCSICLYDAASWTSFTVATYKKLSSCYSKCMKSFFGYCKYSSVTSMLFELGSPSFNTLMHNCKCSFECSLLRCSNMLVCSMLGK